jgi:hypothetical protein
MFKVYLRHKEFALITEMYVIEHRHDNKLSYLTISGSEQPPTITTINIGEDPKPFLTFSGTIAQEFFQGLAEALDAQGIKTDKDAKIQGTLEATKYHLEDLRTLLKLKGDKP